MSLVKKLGIVILGVGLLEGCEFEINTEPKVTYSYPITIDAIVLQKTKLNKNNPDTKSMYSVMMKNPLHLVVDDEINYIEFGNEKTKVGIDDKNIYQSYEIGQRIILTYREIYQKEGKFHSNQFILAKKK